MTWLKLLQNIIHYSNHLLVPGLLAWLFFPKDWKKAWVVMILSMAVDLDHLLASPIFDPNRCGIGFHPLHTPYAMVVYVVMLWAKKAEIRMLAVGLLFHMITDTIDCLFMFAQCDGCYAKSALKSWLWIFH